MGCSVSRIDDESKAAAELSAIISTAQVSGFEGSAPPVALSARIVVVGAGPAGIHMASCLKRLGYEKVCVLEKSARMGGKSRTYVDEDGIPSEMGTCYLHSDYVEIRRLLKLYGLEDQEFDTGPGERFRSCVARPFDADKTGQGFSTWLLAQTEKRAIPSDVLRMLAPNSLQKLTIFAKVQQYAKMHRRLVGIYPFSLPGRPASLEEVAVSFADLLKKENLWELEPLLRYAHETQGYGVLEDVPALYGLWWTTPEFLLSAITLKPKHPGVAMLACGFERLWRTIAEKDGLDVECNVDIEKIERREPGGAAELGDSVRVHVKGEAAPRTFDVLMTAFDVSANLGLVEDLAPEEKAIFSHVEPYTLATALVKADAPTQPERPVNWWWWRLPEDDRVHATRKSADALQRTGSVSDQSKVKFVTYQFNPRAPDEAALEAALLEDLAASGETNVEVLESRPWRYFPHFSKAGIIEGGPWKLRSLQGARRTYFLGSSVCFESVLDVVQYNLDVLRDITGNPDAHRIAQGLPPHKGKGKGKGKGTPGKGSSSKGKK